MPRSPGDEVEVAGMTARRIVVLDDDPLILQLARHALTPPDFEVFTFSDPRDALMKLHEIRPELIICDVTMPTMDGRTFFQVVKRSESLRRVPFIFLSGLPNNEEILSILDAGADDFLSKPFPVARLAAKVRALLRLTERVAADAGQSGATASGAVGPGGTIPILKFCEDYRLTGRLTVESGGQRRWAEFRGGELVQAGGEPTTAGEDALDALLAMTDGTYRIDQARLDTTALAELQSRLGAAPAKPAEGHSESPTGAPPEEGPPPMPPGRLSVVEASGVKLQVQTEAENKPAFTVTTVVVRDGQVLRRIENTWHQPLQRRDDLERALAQIQQQHERVEKSVREMSREGAPRPAPRPSGLPGVEASLLAWALSFISEQAQSHLGMATTVALLRRTQRDLRPRHPPLQHFHVAENGRVVSDLPAGSELLPEAVASMAAWAKAFLGLAGTKAEAMARLPIRHVTKMIEEPLQKAGFYSSFEEVAPK
jgi:CheY-like chemotaxis protein